MQIENDYDKEVYNGDIGMVADVDPEAGELTGRFEGRNPPLRLRRARRAGAGLRRDGAQEPGLGVSGGGNPGADAALRDAEAEPALHGGHAGQAASWSLWGRRRRSPSRCAMRPGDAAGRSSTNGWPERSAVPKPASTAMHGFFGGPPLTDAHVVRVSGTQDRLVTEENG